MRLRVLLLCAVTASGGLGVVACSEKEPPSAKRSTGDLQAAAPPAESPSILPNTPAMARVTDEPAAPAQPRTAVQPPRRQGAAGRPSGGTGAAAASPVAHQRTSTGDVGAPVAPSDARFTILVHKLSGPGHVEQARVLKDDLERVTRRKDWYLTHGPDDTRLYFGFYRSTNNAKDPKEARRARADRALVAGVQMADKSFPFRAAAFVPIDAPDPTSRPEWNLANVDLAKNPKDESRAYWSLQVMAFKDDPKRKEAAVQAVEALRASGYEAYYFHGETVSSVTVGKWPRLAIKEQEGHGDHTVVDQSADLLVLSEPPPRKMSPYINKDGKRVVPVAPKIEIVDPSLRAMIKKFPEHALNYEVKIRPTADGRGVPTSSFIVEIPRAQGNGYYDYEDGQQPLFAGDRPVSGAGGPGSAMTNPRGERGRIKPQPRNNYIDLTGGQ